MKNLLLPRLLLMSESSSESSSEDEIAKPVYVLKKQQGESNNASRKILLSQLELKGTKVDTEDRYDVDDTDDLDPQLEYENWKQREKLRFLRDQQLIRDAEMEKERKKKDTSNNVVGSTS